jgi:UDP-N-acetylglucosamine:LPS N-acetylglucosamine transferase
LDNAKTFCAAGYSRMLDEKDGEALVDLVLQVYQDRQEIVHRIEEFAVIDSVAVIADLVSLAVERRT